MSKIALLSASAAMMAGICFSPENGSGGAVDRPTLIRDALGRLDTETPTDWTQGGLADMERMKSLTGLSDLTRTEVSAVAPGFTRDNAKVAPSDLSNVGTSTIAKDAGPSNDDGKDQPEPDRRRIPTAQELAEALPDPILLMEAAVAAANASDRHRRNGPLHQIVRHFMVDQVAIKDHQARLDTRQEQREAQAEEAQRRDG